jgi:hypothetical protein
MLGARTKHNGRCGLRDPPQGPKSVGSSGGKGSAVRHAVRARTKSSMASPADM